MPEKALTIRRWDGKSMRHAINRLYSIIGLGLALSLGPAGAWAQWPGCADQATGLDMSRPANPRLLEAARRRGITTIFRYYDWEHHPGQVVRLDKSWEFVETLCGRIPKDKLCGEPLSGEERATVPPQSCGKVLSRTERDLIHSYGLDIAIVFQHRNNCPRTLEDSRRGDFDAQQALGFARRLSQPRGTTIYFGVDGADARLGDERDHGRSELIRYFRQVESGFDGSGYDIGVYGSGLVCRLLKDELKIARYCWLSQSPGHPESRGYEAAGGWDVKQCRTINDYAGSGVDVDPDIVNGAEFGQWRAGR